MPKHGSFDDFLNDCLEYKKKIDWGDDDMKEGEQENGEQEVHEDASPFPTLEEAAKMAQGIQTKPQIKEKKCDNPDVVVNNDDDFSMDFIPPVYEHAKPPPPMQPYFQPTTDGNPIGLSTLVVLSTGAGKSLCYQLPAYMYAQKYNCMTLVISPLVSLMDDQVVGLPKCLNGACLHSGMTKAQRTKVVKQILEGKIHVLLISPEALVGGGGSKSGCLPPISQLPPVVLKESLGVQCMLGLTATATLATASSVALHLGINNYQRAVVRGFGWSMKGDRFCSLDSIIIYCTRREGTERLASLLRTCLPDTPLHEEFHEENETETEKETKGKAKGKGKGAVYMSTVGIYICLGVVYMSKLQCLGEEFPDDGIDYSEISEEQMMLGVNATNDSPLDDNLSHSNNTPHSDSIPQGKKSPHSDSIPQGNKSPHSDSTPQGNKSPHSDSTSDNDNSPHNDNTQEKSSMESTGHENTSPKRLPRLCPGHERALSIDETVENLDMKEEGVATLLCYLELHPQQWLENLQPTTGLCRISCYGGPKQLLSTSKKCPPLAAAIAFDRRKGISHRNDASIEFPVVEVASSMGWDSWPVKKELRQLQWNNEAVSGRPIGGKSGVFVEFSDISFHFRSPGDLTDDELDGVCDFLAGRVKSQEKAELYQLQCVYDSLHSVSFSDYWHCSDDVNTKRSEKLKGMLREYFERQPTDTSGKIGKLTFGQELSSEILNTMQLQEKIENEIQIRQEVRSFICLHHDRDFSGRAIARIFHGIESPCYPAKVWGRDRRYWRCHLDADFNSLIKIANSEILSLR
uniref:ATP-dependent DNA helicase Q4-like n=1 Tax=Saccoglossus kowalevskii TaxID=10224 RepID=A0ABM0MQC6_SACKO|nr:PREDICTED: ATP-dependent DNA helicase Q4-like [Saccoglossus kowalevskii]